MEIENSLKNPPVKLTNSNLENYLKIKTTGSIDLDVTIGGVTYTLYDDGDGNLYDNAHSASFAAFKSSSFDRNQGVLANGSGSEVGNVFYSQGLIVLTDTGSYDGDITAFSTTTASDARLKSDIHTINDALGIVGKLRGVSYKWLRDGKSDIGVIAQEVEQVIPEVVKTKKTLGLDGEEEIKTVDYGKMVGVLINAVNELKAEIEELKNAKTTG